MCQHLQHDRHQQPNHPQCTRSTLSREGSIQEQLQQKHDFNEEPKSDPRIPSSSSVNDVIPWIIILLIALTGFKAESTPIISIAAFLFTLLIGNLTGDVKEAIKAFFHFLKQKGI